MEIKLHQSRFLRPIHIPILLLALFQVVLGPEPGSAITTQPPPAYTVETDFNIVTPTCIMLTWEQRPRMNVSNGSRIATVKLWRIVLNVVSNDQRTETVGELILAGSRSNITLGPFALGSVIWVEVHLHKYVTADGRTVEPERSLNVEGRPVPTIGLDLVQLPGNDSLDRSCSKSYGRRASPCSECVCISSTFTGPNCEDPNFKPHNVSAWPLSDGSLHIQWTFNATKHRRSLDRANFRLSNISLSVTEANTGSLVISDSVPINNHSEAYGYEVYQKLSSGVEYDVVVGVGAVRSSNLVVANSSVRTFIPETEDGQALALSDAAVSGIIVGVAVGSCLLASLASVIITAVCMQARSKRTRHTQPVPVRAINPNSNLPLPPPRIPPNMERNPAYGQLLTLSGDSDTADYQHRYRNGQLDALAEGYENTGTASTSGMYLYITQ